ncbi:MAG: hypothetical protein ACOY5Y_07165 [Pseudomonadota bacterium]
MTRARLIPALRATVGRACALASAVVGAGVGCAHVALAFADPAYAAARPLGFAILIGWGVLALAAVIVPGRRHG